MHAAANIPLTLLLVFGSAKLLAEIFERLGQPAIVGEIIAGALIGPGVLGWIAPNDVLQALGDLGVMFLLFRVGLEVKTSELLRVGFTATLVATCGVLVPFVAGWAVMAMWHTQRVESLFVAAAMVATSVGITAQVLASHGLLEHRASKVILAAAVIDDVLGLIVLAVVSGVARGRVNVADLMLTAALAVGFTVVVALWGTKAVGGVMQRAEANLRAGEVQFNIAMLLLFGLALLATFAGVAAIIGAFLAGMALAEPVGQRVRDLTNGVAELMVPFFLAGVGLHLDVRAFANRNTLWLAVLVLIAAVLSKLVGCGLGAALYGWGDMLRIGVGMIPRGEVGMVVAQLGERMGIIPPAIYSVVVFMAVATTVVAPPLLALAYRGLSRGRVVQEYQIG